MGTHKTHRSFTMALIAAAVSYGASADAATTTQYSFDMRQHAQLGVAAQSAAKAASEIITAPDFVKIYKEAMVGAQAQARAAKVGAGLRVQLVNTLERVIKARECMVYIIYGYIKGDIIAGNPQPACWDEAIETMKELEIKVDGLLIEDTTLPDQGRVTVLEMALLRYERALDSGIDISTYGDVETPETSQARERLAEYVETFSH